MWASRRVLSAVQRHSHRLPVAAAALIAFTVFEEKRRQRGGDDTKIIQCEEAGSAQQNLLLRRTRSTVRRMDQDSESKSINHMYNIDWNNPIGEGSFGIVYRAIHKATNFPVAVKKVSKLHSSNESLQNEMRALLQIKRWGSHPNICSLLSIYKDETFYYFVLDLISGGELFDHLVSQGAYSEADAARLVREVASALAFLHGLGVAHCDLKPENLMLSTPNPSDAVIKLIDFGCAKVESDFEYEGEEDPSLMDRTLAYCPPEVLLDDKRKLDPGAIDMWALGVILYIMLTGIHPYDLSGKASDEEVAESVVSGKEPPLRNSAITAHLSDSAIDLIESLMQQEPSKRLTADQMLQHPWTKGETANRDKMVDSDKKLSFYNKYKSGINQKVFENIMRWADEQEQDSDTRLSLIERSFRSFDSQKKGYLDVQDLSGVKDQGSEPPDDKDSSRLSLSGFSDLLAENMKNKYFPKGKIVYHEGEIGNSMYFINSGTISVETGGLIVKRGPGDFFGEGALLHPQKLRSATIRCNTPVHTMEISREFFEKYLAKSDSDLMLTLREKNKIRKRNRAKMILRLQADLADKSFVKDDIIFKEGDDGDSIYLVESGLVYVLSNDKHVFTAKPGNVFGEYSLLMSRSRNCKAVCGGEDGCRLSQMTEDHFRRLMDRSPDVQMTLRDLCFRRDLKKAIVMRLNKGFPYDNPREAFEAVKTADCSDDRLSLKAVGRLMRELNPNYTDEEILEIMHTMDLTNSGTVTFEEFKKVFISDIRKAASV